MIKLAKENENTWCVWDTRTGKCAEIVKIYDYILGKEKIRYRVDVAGITVNSLIEKFQIARSVAYKAVWKAIKN